MSSPTICHSLPGTSRRIIFSFGCICWKSRHISNFYMVFKIVIHDHPINWFACQEFSLFIPMWLTWSCSNASFCNVSDIATSLPFSITPSITLKMTGMFSSIVVFDPCFLASFWWYVLWAVVGVHLVKLPVVDHVLPFYLVCL